MSKLAANKYNQAVKELATISEFQNGFEIPKEIQAHEAHCYHTICISAKQAKGGMSMLYAACVKPCHVGDWNNMTNQGKDTTEKNLWGGRFQKVVILHDPAYKPKAEKVTDKEAKTDKE